MLGSGPASPTRAERRSRGAAVMAAENLPPALPADTEVDEAAENLPPALPAGCRPQHFGDLARDLVENGLRMIPQLEAMLERMDTAADSVDEVYPAIRDFALVFVKLKNEKTGKLPPCPPILQIQDQARRAASSSGASSGASLPMRSAT